ncbi:hypothetical protein VNI00_009112 [Paramarasmius palmivorus]|uniref:AB hydrolase-1 domain-containing protein n=1 Tax=Paramarasmius palmivorus TaxID=297713 RepID=A0AAW0CUM5_9AGAR
MVPLNYSDPEGQTAAIALIRIKANVSTDSPEYRGPVIHNPGGPGGSGIDNILQYGQKMARTLGPQFDIVTFDPRGVSRSTPKVSYFNTSLDRQSWMVSAPQELNNLEDVGTAWARSKIEGQLAGDVLPDILPHIQTDHTARDMLRIVEAHGRDKIQYWGISTWLHVEWADTVDIANFKDFLLDADEALKWFFKDCHAAGPELCAFYEESPEAIEERLNRLYDSVKQAPVPASYNTLALEAGNGTLYATPESPQNPCDVNPWEEAFGNVQDAAVAIRCNDGDIVPPDLEDAQKHYEEITQVSEWGSVLAVWRIACRHVLL